MEQIDEVLATIIGKGKCRRLKQPSKIKYCSYFYIRTRPTSELKNVFFEVRS
jgi:hypothetical protein